MSFISPLARVTTVVVAGIFFFVITRLSSSFQQEKVIEIKPQRSYVEPSNVIPRYTQLSGDSIQDALAFVRDFDRFSGKSGNLKNRSLVEKSVEQLIQRLQLLQVSVVVLEPDQALAQGEWNYRRREIRLHPSLLKSGLNAFSKTLNHEVVHVVQSCSGGSVTDYPRPIGLSSNPSKAVQEILMKPPYADQSPKVLELEIEAFMHQNRPDLVSEMLVQFCFP
jgi:hypothetical protein